MPPAAPIAARLRRGAGDCAALIVEDPVLLGGAAGRRCCSPRLPRGSGAQLLGAARASDAADRADGGAGQRAGQPPGAHRVRPPGRMGPAGAGEPDRRGGRLRAVFALRLLVVSLACLLVVCAADPDELLLALRRVSPRSALTAALRPACCPCSGRTRGASPRPSAAAPTAAPAARGAGWRSCARRSRARWSARWTSPRCSRCAATARRPTGARPRRAPRSRHDLAFAAAARRDPRAGARSPARRRGALPRLPARLLRASRRPRSPRRADAARWRWPRSPTAEGSSHERR